MRAAVGALWTLLQQIYTNLLSALAFAVLARLLGPSSFGLAALAQVFVQLSLLFADLGVTPSLVRLRAVTDSQLNTSFWLGLSIGLGLCGLWELGAGLAASFLHEPKLALIVRVVAISIPIMQLNAVPTALLSRDMRMRPQATRQIVSATAATIGALALAFLGAGVWALVFQDFGTIVIDVTMLWLAVDWRPRFTFSRRDARGLLGFGLQVTATQIVNQGRDRVVQILIGRVLGATDVGYWAIANQISAVATGIFSTAINEVALPTFSLVQHDFERLARALRHGVRMLGFVSMPILCGLGALSPRLIPLLFGDKWAVVGGIAAITAVTAAINTVQWLDGNVWWAIGKPSVQTHLVWTITAVHLVAVWYFARYGLTAVAWALFGRTIFSFALRLITLIRIGHLPAWCYRDMPAIAFCSAVMYLAMRTTGVVLSSSGAAPVLLAQAAVGTVVYLGLSILLQRQTLLELRRDVLNVLGSRRASTVPT